MAATPPAPPPPAPPPAQTPSEVSEAMAPSWEGPRFIPVSGLGRRFSALGRPLEGWRVASKGLPPLRRRRGSALAYGCGMGGRVVLPLARAAAVSTGLTLHAVTSTGSPAEPSLPASLVRSSAVIPEGWLCLQAKGSATGFCRGGMLSA